jgi:hypothetical protein
MTQSQAVEQIMKIERVGRWQAQQIALKAARERFGARTPRIIVSYDAATEQFTITHNG